MAKSKMTSITQPQFAAFHEMLMEKTYGDSVEEIKTWPDTKLYGHTKIPSIHSIKVKADFTIGGRSLLNAVIAYKNRTLDKISVRLLNEGLNFLGYNSIGEMEEKYLENHSILPHTLKYVYSAINQRVDDKLSSLMHTSWKSYSRYLNRKSEGVREIRMLPLRIEGKMSNGDYSILLENDGDYTSFAGKIRKNHSSSNVLCCELYAINAKHRKPLYLMIYVNPGTDKTLYLGSYLRHTDNGSIYSGTFVIEKVENDTPIRPNKFAIEEVCKGEIKEEILNYLYDRRLNVLKIPTRVYTQKDFRDWQKRTSKKRNYRKPIHDLFIAAPVQAFDKQEQKKNHLQSVLLDMLRKEDLSGEAKGQISEFFKLHFSGFSIGNKNISFQEMHQQIQGLIKELKSEPFGLKNIWYSASTSEGLLNRKIDSGIALERQLMRFSMSKRALLLVPPHMTSSVLIEAGWAMISARNIPTLIVANRTDLPFLLQKADTLNDNIFIVPWDEFDSIGEILVWFHANDFHNKN